MSRAVWFFGLTISYICGARRPPLHAFDRTLFAWKFILHHRMHSDLVDLSAYSPAAVAPFPATSAPHRRADLGRLKAPLRGQRAAQVRGFGPVRQYEVNNIRVWRLVLVSKPWRQGRRVYTWSRISADLLSSRPKGVRGWQPAHGLPIPSTRWFGITFRTCRENIRKPHLSS